MIFKESTKEKSDFKIILINISLRPYLPNRNFPIGLSYIATSIKKAGYDFKIIDIEAYRYSNEELEKILKNEEFDVVAFGALVTGYKIVKELSSMIKRVKSNTIIIAGNSVASSVPEILLNNTEVDIAVIGEGEVTIIEILDKLRNSQPLDNVKGISFKKDSKIISTPKRECIENIDSFADWELFDIKTYLKYSILDVPDPTPISKDEIRAFVINTARGCPFNCTFCYHVFKKDKYRYRSPRSILSEIDLLQKRYGINYVFFYDELTFFNKLQAEDFVNEILKSGLRFFWNIDARADLFNENDKELLKKLKMAGCNAVGYSLESANEDILKSMNKRLKVEDFVRQKKAFDMFGIKTFTSLVIGYPQETFETIRQTFNLCYELDIYPSAGYLLPQPMTSMYELAKQKRLIVSEEDYLLKMGDRQDLRINLTDIPDEVLINEVKMNLKRISDKLNLGITEKKLLKTGTFVTTKDTVS